MVALPRRRSRVLRRAFVLLITTATVLAAAVAPAGAAPTALPDPTGAALDWLEGELAADGGYLTTRFGPGEDEVFDDWGLTIDAILALVAGGRGDAAAATTADGHVEDNVASYVSGADFGAPDDRYAAALGKTLVMAAVQGEDPRSFGGFDLVAELLARLRANGPDAGRFSDKSDFGDFSNGLGQALAIMGLASAGQPVPDSAVDFLLAQQCPGGGFRIDYAASGGCQDDGRANVDGTAFAVQALVSVAPTCAVGNAVSEAIAWLLAAQGSNGSFGADDGVNTNSTGLAANALRSLGETGAADSAAAFVASLQLADGDDMGAIARDQAGFDAAADGVGDLERDGFRRATGQAVLAFGLPTYAELGGATVDPAVYAPCAPPAPATPPTPPASAQPTISLSSTTVRAGDQLTISGSGFAAGEGVGATIFSSPVVLGTTTTDAGGALSLTVTVPDLEPGVHRIEVRGQTSGLAASASVEVLAREAPRTLPATGSASAPTAVIGLALVLSGTALVRASRTRASRAQPAPAHEAVASAGVWCSGSGGS